ncbi:MAG TPA: MFS transporter, partial [Chloroflexia bacterium]|nr:MFS transporter [Chloroflexia bacterium]
MAVELPAGPPQAIPAGTRPAPYLGHGQMFAISAMWFALSVLWGSILTLIAPIQVEDILRRTGLSAADITQQKSFYLGLVVAAGAVVALVIPPIVGALSDRSTHRLGRRRPYI